MESEPLYKNHLYIKRNMEIVELLCIVVAIVLFSIGEWCVALLFVIASLVSIYFTRDMEDVPTNETYVSDQKTNKTQPSK